MRMHQQRRDESGNARIEIADVLRRCSVALALLMVLVFFAGCATRSDEAGSSGVMREPEQGREIHGEAGASYGRSF
jgi:hypothetical protein